jgi:ATP-dependent Clp protease adaptor protein ClpS
MSSLPATPPPTSLLAFLPAPRASSGSGEDGAKKPPGDTRGKESVDVQERQKTEKPRMFRVLLHNDDYTTMEFVVWVLMEVFRKTQVEATRVMLTVHRSGKGIAGVYSREVAETKAALTVDRAREAGFPLMATTEPEP